MVKLSDGPLGAAQSLMNSHGMTHTDKPCMPVG